MMEFVWGVLTACLGSLGFALMYHVDLKHLPWGVLGGGLSWAAYLVVFAVSDSVFAAAFAGAVIATLYADVLAYLCRTPATVFLLPGLIPLVPGGSLYYTMSYLIAKNYDMAAIKGIATAEVMLGISLGVVMGSLVVYTTRYFNAKRKTQQKS